METHRFVRRKLAESSSDCYDLNLKTPGNKPSSAQEYWTNGTTTFMSLPATKSFTKTNLVDSSPQIMNPTPGDEGSIRYFSSRKREKHALEAFSGHNIVRDSLVAGSVGGMASIIVCHPFDVLRTKMQTSAFSASANVGVVGTFRQTLQQGGFRALYAGLALPLGAQALYKATVFTVNNLTEKAIVDWKTLENHKLGNFTPYKLTLADRFMSGFVGGAVVAALFVTPVEYVRNQQIVESTMKSTEVSGMSQAKKTRGPIDVIRRTVRSKGVSGLWRGVSSTMLRDSIGCGFFFVAMNYSQKYFSNNEEPPSRPAIVASGALAGTAFWIVGLPLDTLKTWIQNGSAKNLSDAFRLSQQHGLANSIVTLNRGWQVAYGRGAPSAAISVTVYSTVFNYMSQIP